MNINWVIANRAEIDPTVDIGKLKEMGSLWGGWKTWRSFQTDNVICHDQIKCAELLKRNFQNMCNFYIPNHVYSSLNRPANVKIYEGEFVHDVDNQEDIVAMHLASTNSDIVLLVGFNFGEQTKNEDKLAEHRAQNYRNLTRQIIVTQKQVQWVVIDHSQEFRKDTKDLANLGQDTLSNILKF